MAVYTEITKDELESLLEDYDLGTLVSFAGIAQGVENSNYDVTTTQGRYVLTLFESRVDENDLPFFFDFIRHLQQAGIFCPETAKRKDGDIFSKIAGKKAVFAEFMSGTILPDSEIGVQHCASLGKTLAHMHLAAQNFKGHRENALSLAGWRDLYRQCNMRADKVEAGLGKRIAEELQYLHDNWPTDLPRGVIHADAFPDNIFFDERQNVSGVIDFYFSCDDFFAYDLALVINCWCFGPDGIFYQDRLRALLDNYEALRPLDLSEKHSLSVLCRGAAMRILLTRLYDWLNHDPNNFVTPKDPKEYIEKLIFHQQQGNKLFFEVVES